MRALTNGENRGIGNERIVFFKSRKNEKTEKGYDSSFYGSQYFLCIFTGFFVYYEKYG